ncbi:DMT family transporter [Amycolatopsis jiangsuensis]|uniref:Drug/metabolite transporter (DMT)-like permease n=1 Tax=Amycolatopsis jiangsuensis TaxID=1181879 RepID=A0A840J244_9PSEU|nr:DMT family transporter [Amycolatopsis jiangsuensis]MBB4689086.1 drug/metabolite transporter (DMT)-like permease [Amycolatopsis jiangsuensis]
MSPWWPAIPAAVAGSIAFGATGALQHRAARRTGERGAVRVGILRSLAAQPMWVASLAVNAAGVVLQWIALSTAPLVLVQPLLALGLVFAVLVSGVLARRRPDRVVVAGTGLTVAGIAAFLVLARPTAGSDRPTLAVIAPSAAVLGVVLALCVAIAVRHRGQPRALALGTATGVLFGVTACLAKLAAADFTHGLGTALSGWPLYAVAGCGITGFLMSQNAFRAEIAMAPALALMLSLDPLVSVLVGALWLGEGFRHDLPALAGEASALVVLLAGIAVLSTRAPQAVRAQR